MDADRLAKMFKALSNPNRLRLFQEIRRGQSAIEPAGCILNPIKERLKIGAPTVSHHLKELVNAGLIATERRGRLLHCRSLGDAIAELERFFNPDTDIA